MAELAYTIMLEDAKNYGHVFPAYREYPLTETHRVIAALAEQTEYAQRFAEFSQLMVYGNRPEYTEALATTRALAAQLPER